jgi:SAM-dependent methyltransferase
VAHFGQEWSRFDQQRGWGAGQLEQMFDSYFAPLPPKVLCGTAIVGDFGAGSGRWASIVADRVAHLYLIEPSREAMAVARHSLRDANNVTFIEEAIGGASTPVSQLDLAYSLGVIHHVPDPSQALRDVRSALKPGGVFLGYLYYALDNRPIWFRALWKLTDRLRGRISRLEGHTKRIVTDVLAAVIYWPLARIARLLSRAGLPISLIPLSQYADKTFYVMRNDSLDRFGTPLERRFSKSQIIQLLNGAGFDTKTVVFSDNEPFWCFSVRNAC